MLLFIRFPDSMNPFKVKDWIEEVIAFYDFELENLEIQEVDEEEISELHQYYFRDPSPTDILTLNYARSPKTINGLLYVCPEFIEKNKEQYSRSGDFEEALLRVIVHGLLHLIGFNDATPELQKEMIRAEDEALRRFGKNP